MSVLLSQLRVRAVTCAGSEVQDGGSVADRGAAIQAGRPTGMHTVRQAGKGRHLGLTRGKTNVIEMDWVVFGGQ